VGASVEVYGTLEEREFVATRFSKGLLSEVGLKAEQMGMATNQEMAVVTDAWKEWTENDDGYLGMTSTEVLCHKGT
jgi:hypothetical protein